MPIYEYVCRHCGEELERLQKLADAALTDCPACGESALKRKVSAAGFRLAGSGWYETDFKSKDRRNLAGGQGTKASEGESGGAKSQDKPKAGKPAKADKSAATDQKAKSGRKNQSARSSRVGADSA